MESLRPHTAKIVAVGLIVLTAFLAQPARLSSKAKTTLASGFHFTKLPLPEPNEYPHKGPVKNVRQVHPSLKRISAWISATGAAIALGDIDGDGLDNDYSFIDPRTDAIVIGGVPVGSERYKKFVLDPGALCDNTMAPMGSLIGDFNEDGLTDVLVYYFGRTPIVFLRQNTKTSPDAFVATELKPGGERWFTCAVCQADLDGDGHQDLLVCNYYRDGGRLLDSHAKGQEELHDAKSKSYNGGAKHFLLWQKNAIGSLPYRDTSTNLSKEVLHGWTVASATADLDGDLLPEIYLANDLGPDRLLLNQSKPGNLNFKVQEGKRDFTTPASSVLGFDSYKGMGVDFADINNDGYPDIFVSNIASEYGFMESNFLWLSNPSKAPMPTYKQESEKLNLSRNGWGWDARLADFNNDGTLEAIQATGFIKGKVNRWPELQSLGTGNDQMMHDARNWPSFKPGDDISGHETNAFFVKAKDSRYYNLNRELGLAQPMVSRGIAVADVDGDGDLDFAVANQWEPSFFYRNDRGNNNQSMELRLVVPGRGPKGEFLRPAVGAVAKLKRAGGKWTVAQVDGGSGHSGKRSQDIHFGLGEVKDSQTFTVELSWRDSSGQIHKESKQLTPGWHQIVLAPSSKEAS